MEEVLVDGVVRLGLRVHRYSVLGAVREQVAPALERLDELGIAPGCDGLDLRVECLGAHLESHLIVALAGGTVRDVKRPLLLRDADHLLGDARTGHGRAEEVPSLVYGVALERLVYVILDEFLPQVGHDALGRSRVRGLDLDGLEILVLLPDVGAEAYHLETLLAEPLEDDGGVEPAGVGEDYLGLAGGGHDDSSFVLIKLCPCRIGKCSGNNNIL